MMAEENTTDKISELPDYLLHYILSFLPVKYAARTSILSKRWNSIWTTLPYLDFGGDFLNIFVENGRRRRRKVTKQLKRNKHFLKLATKIIWSRQQIVSIQKLCLGIPNHEISNKRRLLEKKRPSPLDFKLERLISGVANRGLQELELSNFTSSCRFRNLPSTILSAKSINVLTLFGFNLMPLSSLDVQFPSLQKLFLRAVCLEDEIFRKLIKGCPSLESLQLRCCEGVKTMSVIGLLKLKVLDVQASKDLEILEIEAPYLQVLEVIQLPSSSCEVNVAACSGLSRLKLYGEFITERWLRCLLSGCLFLENLSLSTCVGFENNISISIGTLKTLKLDLCRSPVPVVAEINAPNLEKFLLAASKLAVILLNASNKLEIELGLYPTAEDVKDPWHDQLALFLGHFNHFNTVKLTSRMDQAVIIPKEKRDNLRSPLYDTRNLIFSTYKMKFEAVELVEYMLWLSPRAETVSITSTDSQFQEKIDTILQCHYGKNVHEDSSAPCCKLLPTHCWQH